MATTPKTPEEIVFLYGTEVTLLFRWFCEASGLPDTEEERILKGMFEKSLADIGDRLLGRTPPESPP